MQKLRELLMKVSKILEYKINIQMLIAFLYTSNEQSEMEIKNTIYNASKM